MKQGCYFVFYISLTLAMVGCAAMQRAGIANRAQTSMVGMSKQQILQCMGVAGNSQSVGQTEVWEYYAGGASHTSVNIFNNTDYNNQYAFGTATTTRSYCKIDVVFIDDKVTNVRYSGNTGGLLTRGEVCAEAVSGCVR